MPRRRAGGPAATPSPLCCAAWPGCAQALSCAAGRGGPDPALEVALSPSLEVRFADALRGLLPEGARRLLVACSGGGDSAALAALTAGAAPALGLEAALAHCDHGLREGSAAEAEAVRALGEQLGLPVHALTLALPAAGNLEAAARRARYAALGELAERLGAAALLTGHTADDKAETLWLWLLRGTGPAGLSPLPASRPLRPGAALRVLRPLLGFRREELRDYLRAREIPWLEDPSNTDLALRRNRVRHRLLPSLVEEYGIDPTANALRLADQMAELLAYLDSELAARGLGEEALAEDDWSRSRIASLPAPLARRFLSQALARRGLHSPRSIDDALRLLGEAPEPATLGFKAEGEDWRLVLDAKRVTLERGGDPPGPPPVPQVESEAAFLPAPPAGVTARLPFAGGWALILARREGNPGPPSDVRSAVFDAEKLAEPLRLARAGDRRGQRIRLLGGPGSRLVSDVFIDRKVPRRWRAAWPLLLDADGQLLWLPGLARGEAAPVGPQTKRCLCLDLEPPCA